MPLRRFVSQPEHRLQPQPEFWFELDVPPTLLHEPQPHRRQQLQPGEVPPTLPQPPQPQDEPLPCVQVQVHVHVGFVVDVPPTEPEDCLQHGLQHRCWTKSGNVRPLKPLQKQAIAHTSKKSPGTSVPGAFYALRARLVSGSVGFRLDGRHRRVDDLLRLALRPLRLFHKGSPRR